MSRSSSLATLSQDHVSIESTSFHRGFAGTVTLADEWVTP